MKESVWRWSEWFISEFDNDKVECVEIKLDAVECQNSNNVISEVTKESVKSEVTVKRKCGERPKGRFSLTFEALLLAVWCDFLHSCDFACGLSLQSMVNCFCLYVARCDGITPWVVWSGSPRPIAWVPTHGLCCDIAYCLRRQVLMCSAGPM